MKEKNTSEIVTDALIEGFQKIMTRTFDLIYLQDLDESQARLIAKYNEMTTFISGRAAHSIATERMLSEEQKKSELASRSKSRFLANMSHEIRTPINGIIGLGRMLLDAPLAPQQQEQVKMLLDSASYLHGLINDILDLSKIEEGKLKMETSLFSIDEIIGMVSHTVMYSASQKQIEFKVQNSFPNEFYLLGDPLRLRQILINLLSNAIKFTPEKGTVKLVVERDEMTATDVTVKVHVIDSGIGLDSETKSRLFRPFEQADVSTTRRFGGTGLGLSISKNLAEMMGGSIGVESKLGFGADFWFTVRLGLGPSMENLFSDQSGVQVDLAALQAPQERVKVLMAEDHLINQVVMKALLEKYELDVDVVGNGREALEAVKTGKYQLVLMDCQMPEMDGFEATRSIRSLDDFNLSRIPIIALTANAMSGDKEQCLSAGMNGFIGKPVEIPELERQLRQWLR